MDPVPAVNFHVDMFFCTRCCTVNPFDPRAHAVWLANSQTRQKGRGSQTALNETVVFLAHRGQFPLFLALYLHHDWILPALFNICSSFNYNSPTGLSVFGINHGLRRPVPGQTAVTWICVHHLPTPAGHVISKTRSTQVKGPWGTPEKHTSITGAVMTDSIRFRDQGHVVMAYFHHPKKSTAAHGAACERRCRLLWDMNHAVHCPRVTGGITPSQVLTIASKLELSSGLALTTWSGMLSSSGAVRRPTRLTLSGVRGDYVETPGRPT